MFVVVKSFEPKMRLMMPEADLYNCAQC